jgi:hypothetical protein
MACANGIQRIRSDTSRQKPDYSLGVKRVLAPGQPAFEAYLDRLKHETGGYIDFKRIGSAGIKLLMLDDILQAAKVAQGNNTSAVQLPVVENQLNELFKDLPQQTFEARIYDRFYPFYLYGQNRQNLALKLNIANQEQQHLTGREVVIDFFKDEYGVPEKTLRQKIGTLKPDITVGAVQWDELEECDQYDFKKDPSMFIRAKLRANMQVRKELGLDYAPIPILPDVVCLNGLETFREAKAHRYQK